MQAGPVMGIPLAILAVLCLGGGFLSLPHDLGGKPYLLELPPRPPCPRGQCAETPLRTEWMLQIVSEAASLLGIPVAWLVVPAQPHRGTPRPAAGQSPRFLQGGWGFDWLYDRVFVRPFVWLARINVEGHRGPDVRRRGRTVHAPLAGNPLDAERAGAMVRGGPRGGRGPDRCRGGAAMIAATGGGIMLSLFIFVPLAAGARWLGHSPAQRTGFARWLTLAANVVNLCLAARWLGLGRVFPGCMRRAPDRPGWPSCTGPGYRASGISFSLGLDGLSLTLLGLTALLGIMAVLSSWTGITEKVGFFHLNISLVLAGINGVFLATDLFLFVFFWELMLIPMYFLIDIWGHENRHKAAVKFFLFTQVGGLLMLVAIIALAVLHGMATGTWTFALQDLMGTVVSPVVGMLLMLGFFAAFAVKLPAFPLHTWLPDAHTEAPTAGSVILAGLLLKTGGYGLIRFAVPLFPAASRAFAPVAIALAAAGIVYGGIMAFSQKDMKRVVAYTSVSHLGFVLLGRLRVHAAGALGRRAADGEPRDQHGRAVHAGGRPAGQDPHARPRPHGRALGAGAADGRGGAGPLHGAGRAARAW